jgi:hypothetical protein
LGSEKAARKLIEIANSVEAIQDGRIHVEKINWPFLPAEVPSTTDRAKADGGYFGGNMKPSNHRKNTVAIVVEPGTKTASARLLS